MQIWWGNWFFENGDGKQIVIYYYCVIETFKVVDENYLMTIFVIRIIFKYFKNSIWKVLIHLSNYS